ncbi:MAG: hypothetical protein IT430_16230 [Phycisphaerales bacterium]|nr:hypothetical protein [Phycisphaerales bacterium]
MNTHELKLSPQAAQRRDAMREELVDAFVSMHRTRRRVRRIAAPAAVLVIAAAATWALRPTPSATELPITAAAAPLVEVIDSAASGRTVDFDWVASGHAPLVEIVESHATLVQVIDDEQLVQTLAQMNRPAGLIETGGTVRLTRNVVDEGDSLDDRDSRLGEPRLRNTPPAHGV